MYLDGSRMLHERACAIGVTNQLYTFNNAQHVPYISNAAYMDSTERFIRDFLVDVMGCTQTALLEANDMQEQAFLYPSSYCNGLPSNEICGVNNLAELTDQIQVLAYPNPSNGNLHIEANIPISKVSIYSLEGKIVQVIDTGQVLALDVTLDPFQNGIFILETEAQNQQTFRTKIQLLR